MKEKILPILELTTLRGSVYKLYRYPSKDKKFIEILQSDSDSFKDINFLIPENLVIDKVLHIKGIACSNCMISIVNRVGGKPIYEIVPIDKNNDTVKARMEVSIPTTPIASVKINDRKAVLDIIKEGNLIFADQAYKDYKVKPFDKPVIK